MHTLQARLVTLCQQTLALGVVLAVLTPASGVVSLDIVRPAAPGTPFAGGQPSGALMSATVPSAPVEAEVTEVPLTSPAGASRDLMGRSVMGRTATPSRVVSTPQPVTGYAAVGVTWDGEALEEDQITIAVRTRTGDTWSEWQDLEYHNDHAPDPSSDEGANARPGTDPLFVGEVDDVQVEARTEGTQLPADLSVSLIEPGESEQTETEAPAGNQPTTGANEGEDEDAIVLQSQRAIAQPQIFTRAQWGADERIRERGNPDYGTIRAGFVHHTVNANNYSEAQVPGLLRSIYAYHVKSRGWRDIGYNFLVDRFGRIWEGRFGGIDRPVIGAHTSGYNHLSFAMSAIGNFDTVRAPDVMLRSYGQLFAWKLSLHGVNPMATNVRMGTRTFDAINGHRDAGSTACPGRYLYAKLPAIRTYAKNATGAPEPTPTPTEPTGITIGTPSPETNLVGTPHPDLVVRRASDNRAMIIPTGGLTSFANRRVIGERGWGALREVVPSPDLTGDGIADLATVKKNGVLQIRPGTRSGTFAKPVRHVRSARGASLFTAVGDVTGDARNDLVAVEGRALILFRTNRKGGFKRIEVAAAGFGGYRQLIGAGDITGDGLPDLLGRTKTALYLHAGLGRGRFTRGSALSGNWGEYNHIASGGDLTGDGRPDLVVRTHDGKAHVRALVGSPSWGTEQGPVGNYKRMRHLASGGQFVGGPGPDLVGVSKGRLVLLGNRDTFDLGQPIDTGRTFGGMNLVLNVGDLSGDGRGDVVTRDGNGNLYVYRGNARETLRARQKIATGFGAVTGLRAVGDVTGDGRPDLLGTLNGTTMVWRGNATGGFADGVPVAGRVLPRAGLPSDTSAFDWIITIADMQLGKGPDFVVRDRATGRLLYYNGRSTGVSNPRVLGGDMEVYNLAG